MSRPRPRPLPARRGWYSAPAERQLSDPVGAVELVVERMIEEVSHVHLIGPPLLEVHHVAQAIDLRDLPQLLTLVEVGDRESLSGEVAVREACDVIEVAHDTRHHEVTKAFENPECVHGRRVQGDEPVPARDAELDHRDPVVAERCRDRGRAQGPPEVVGVVGRARSNQLSKRVPKGSRQWLDESMPLCNVAQLRPKTCRHQRLCSPDEAPTGDHRPSASTPAWAPAGYPKPVSRRRPCEETPGAPKH